MNDVFRSFSSWTTTKASMARLRNILHERVHEDMTTPDETGVAPCDEKYARYDTAFNPKALSSRKDDDESYEGEEPGMSKDVTVWEADNVIANTGINPLMFEEGIDTEAWTNVLFLHSLANWFKYTPDVSKVELDKRDKVEAEKPSGKHYRLMEVKKCDSTGSVRRFYWNGTEWYETRDEQRTWVDESDPEYTYIDAEKERARRNRKVAVQLLYRKLKESKAWMKQAYNQKKYALAQEFRKEYEYCSKNLDALKACDEKKKELKIKKRKDILYTNRIKYSNLWGKLTIEDVKRMINEKSLAYAEKVIENKLSELLFKEQQERKNS